MMDTLCSAVLPQPSDSADLCTLSGRYKTQSSDFVVHEQLGFEPGGGGEHLYLFVEKEHLSTFDAVDRLAKVYGVQARNIGYSGMKDKVAITRQWFSVPTPDSRESALEQSDGPGRLSVIQAERHGRKLRIGTHKSNAFELVIRKITPNTIDDTSHEASVHKVLNQRIEDLQNRGYPNYVGPQRFGNNGNNVAKAIHHLQNPKRRIKPKLRGLYISALRSALFNQVLAQRILQNNWLTPLAGEPMMLAGSRSVFVPSVNDSQEELLRRLLECDISTTGPLSGDGESGATDACREFERTALIPYASITDSLMEAKVRADRRALRAVVGDVSALWQDNETLQLNFSLPPGCYASMLVQHLSKGFKQDVGDISAEL